MKKLLVIALFAIMSTALSVAQTPLTYQTPPPEIARLVDAPATPGVSVSPDRSALLLLEQPGYPPIGEVAQPELRLAGIRINPRTNGPSRSVSYNGLTLIDIADGRERKIQGLPAQPQIQYLSWSPDGNRMAFIHTAPNGVELWVAEVKTAKARRIATEVNAAMPGAPHVWLDNQRLACAMIPAGRGAPPQANPTPVGPIVQFNEGKGAPVRTYQDLLTNAHDEALFDYYARAQMALIDAGSGKRVNIGQVGVISGFSASPDGRYLLVSTLRRPYSYLVPASRFPEITAIWDLKGQVVRVIAEHPLLDKIPQGFDGVQTGPRSFAWRADAPATLYWVEAQDEGDPRKASEIRDQLFSLSAPFQGQPQPGPALRLRYRGVTWGDDQLALVYEGWWTNRRQITSIWRPGSPQSGIETLFDRSSEDRYNDPGTFATAPNRFGRSALLADGGRRVLYLIGQGASPEGDRPFFSEFDLSDKSIRERWRSQAPYYETPVALVDPEKGLLITRRESTEEPPNYCVRQAGVDTLRALTRFENPYAGLSKASKTLIRYRRADGVEMTGTLYLPPHYDPAKDGPLPTFMWAYPREFKSADAAGQVAGSPYQFIRLNWGSPLYWIVRGYAVFDNFSMPIIGEGDAEPNETFIAQLKANARAAVDTLVRMGVADPKRIAVGGHSYGAFMTANLLAHTDLFAAGIARSGAYNRTLTPFGFQSEERTYWQAPEVYYTMSPFNFADRIKTPILLIHGEADNNSGTFPIQSERFYAALKGHGATARYVALPAESHGYRARESIMHMLWEMDQWLEKYVKNAQ
ncbi:MAG: prolyl oligopeptidase family serine peptidase [Saprospiraceae bacterium]